jgi:hypothetical protein
MAGHALPCRVAVNPAGLQPLCRRRENGVKALAPDQGRPGGRLPPSRHHDDFTPWARLPGALMLLAGRRPA